MQVPTANVSLCLDEGNSSGEPRCGWVSKSFLKNSIIKPQKITFWTTVPSGTISKILTPAELLLFNLTVDFNVFGALDFSRFGKFQLEFTFRHLFEKRLNFHIHR